MSEKIEQLCDSLLDGKTYLAVSKADIGDALGLKGFIQRKLFSRSGLFCNKSIFMFLLSMALMSYAVWAVSAIPFHSHTMMVFIGVLIMTVSFVCVCLIILMGEFIFTSLVIAVCVNYFIFYNLFSAAEHAPSVSLVWILVFISGIMSVIGSVYSLVKCLDVFNSIKETKIVTDSCRIYFDCETGCFDKMKTKFILTDKMKVVINNMEFVHKLNIERVVFWFLEGSDVVVVTCSNANDNYFVGFLQPPTKSTLVEVKEHKKEILSTMFEISRKRNAE